METIRTFVAIPLPGEILAEFDRLIQKMRGVSRGVKWVRANSIHLTLKFLGNITPEELQAVFRATDKLFAHSPPSFKLLVGGQGAFPNPHHPRVLWVGLRNTGLEPLRKLQRGVEDALAAEGFEPEKRRFSPHLTVGRVKFEKEPARLMNTFMDYPFPDMEFMADRVHVMRSELRPEGAVYSVQKKYRLPPTG